MALGKWIGAGLGWTLGGPIGGLLGFGIGSMLDRVKRERTASDLDDFTVTIVVLTADVMKADGQLRKSELDYVKETWLQNFGPAKAEKALLLLRDVLNQNYSIHAVCQQIRAKVPHPGRLQMLNFLVQLALADGELHVNEEARIRYLAGLMNVSERDVNTFFSAYKNGGAYNSPQSTFEDPYKILQVEPTVDEAGLKKAYRKMAMKYHPDKVQDQGDSAQEAAKRMFQKIQSAYEQIKQERGIA